MFFCNYTEDVYFIIMKKILFMALFFSILFSVQASAVVVDESDGCGNNIYKYFILYNVIDAEYDVIWGNVNRDEVLTSRSGEYFIVNTETLNERKIFSEDSSKYESVPPEVEKLVPFYRKTSKVKEKKYCQSFFD